MSQDQICAHERMLDVHDYCPDCGELRTSWLLEGAKLRARIAELEAQVAAQHDAMRTEWKDLLARAERAEAALRQLGKHPESCGDDCVSELARLDVLAERDALRAAAGGA